MSSYLLGTLVVGGYWVASLGFAMLGRHYTPKYKLFFPMDLIGGAMITGTFCFLIYLSIAAAITVSKAFQK